MLRKASGSQFEYLSKRTYQKNVSDYKIVPLTSLSNKIVKVFLMSSMYCLFVFVHYYKGAAFFLISL